MYTTERTLSVRNVATITPPTVCLYMYVHHREDSISEKSGPQYHTPTVESVCLYIHVPIIINDATKLRSLPNYLKTDFVCHFNGKPFCLKYTMVDSACVCMGMCIRNVILTLCPLKQMLRVRVQEQGVW